MWFDVNAALKEALERHPEEAAPSASDRPKPPLEEAPQANQRTGAPDAIANSILDCLRECKTLAQASVVLTRYRADLSNLETTAPVRKIHIENYVQHMWAGASNLHGNDRRAGAR